MIPVRRGAEGLEVLFISNLKRKRWIIPKGLVEPHLSPEDSAMKEAHEEAGVEGEQVGDLLGTYRYDKWGGTCVVEVFAMHVLREIRGYEEEGMRDRIWVAVEEAPDMVREKGLRKILRELPAALDGLL